MIKTNFSGVKVPKENEHYTCIACITIDSVTRIEKKNYPQVYLEECKCRMKKKKMTKFISTELELGSESESESDAKLKAKLVSESDSDSEQVILLSVIFTHVLTIRRWLLLKWLFTDFEQVKNLIVILLNLKE